MSPATNTAARRSPLAAAKTKAIRRLGWLAFGIGGFLTPGLATKRAAKLWCRLPANQHRRKDNRPHEGHVVSVDVGLLSPLTIETWGPDDAPTVYLVHGWGGWRGQLGGFVDPLLQAGYRVLAFDSLSHGDSGPGEHGPHHSSGGELIQSLEAVTAKYGAPEAVIAHSLGCGAACRSILDGRFAADRLVLVSPNPDMRVVGERYGKSLGFSKRTRKLLDKRMEAWAHRAMGDFDVADMGATGKLPPALVIHDSKDTESPYDVAKKIDRLWDQAQLVTTEGLGHHRILIDKNVIALATSTAAARAQ